MRISPPDTSWARDVQTSIRRGDISQMSIGFVVEDDEWRTENGMDVRELRKVKLFDVSPVTFPAYTATDVGVRAMQEYEGYKAEQRRQSEEAEQAAAKKAREQAKLARLQTKLKIFEEEQYGYQEGIGNEGKERGCQAQSDGCAE